MRCILFRYIYIYTYHKTVAYCAYTSFKNNSFRGGLRGGRREKESSLPPPRTVFGVSEQHRCGDENGGGIRIESGR